MIILQLAIYYSFFFTFVENSIHQHPNESTIEISQRPQVVVFLSPHCPICQNYSSRLNEINKNAKEKGIELLGVISGSHFSNAELEWFREQYEINFDIIIDEKYLYRDKWMATTTPEVIFSYSDSLIYRGMIDNWYYSIGKSSNKTTEHYLIDAIENYLSGDTTFNRQTEPVGCLIE